MKTKEEVKTMLQRISSVRKHPYWWGGDDNRTLEAMKSILHWVLGEATEDEVPFMNTIKEMENGTYQPPEL